MDFTEDAKREIEKNLNEIIKNVSLDEKDRTDIEKELRSSYYEVAENAAGSRGADAVTVEDVNVAKAGMGSPREIADSFMGSYAVNLRRAGFWSRLAAFIIDNVVMAVVMLIMIMPLVILFLPVSATLGNTGNAGQNLLTLAALIAMMIIVAISIIVFVLGYYIVLEGHFGYTPGKYVMGLRVLKADGTKIGYKESFLRNLPKYFDNLIIIDVLIMLVFFSKEKQRGFDRIANTMVIHVKG